MTLFRNYHGTRGANQTQEPGCHEGLRGTQKPISPLDHFEINGKKTLPTNISKFIITFQNSQKLFFTYNKEMN